MKKRLFYFIPFLFLFVACGGDIKLSLYSEDLLSAGKNNEIVYADVNVIADYLKEEADIAFLKNNLYGFSNGQDVSTEYSEKYSFDIKVPIITESKLSSFDDSKVLFKIVCVEDPSSYSYRMEYNKAVIDVINSYFTDTHMQSVSLKEFNFSLTLTNDSKKQKKLKTYSCYVNEEAYPFEGDFDFANRATFNIKPSEILYSAIADYEKFVLFSLDK